METFMALGRGLLGVAVLLGILYLCSADRRAVSWRLVLCGLALQAGLGLLLLQVGPVRELFNYVAVFFVEILGFTREGSVFLFGGLVADVDSFGFIFVFQVLPVIIFFSALTSLLYYLGILQRIVFGFAWLMKRLMRLSGAESLAAAANVFLGQTEAPLLVKPYIPKMTRSELMAIMTGGMATIAGSVLVAYIGLLGGEDPAQRQLFATHLLVASIMNAPAALLVAKLLVPETEEVESQLLVPKDRIGTNALDALATGTSQGLQLALNVAAMLLVFIALVAMLNHGLQLLGRPTGLNTAVEAWTGGRFDLLSLQSILAFVFAPVAWIIGVSSPDILVFGSLLGEKLVINEFVAYSSLAALREAGAFTDEKSIVMATYALCGFANFASIGIQIGGIGVLAPEKRPQLCQLGVKALLGGTVATLLTACIAGALS
jgi:CNT family concentrative nucleoside transporter